VSSNPASRIFVQPEHHSAAALESYFTAHPRPITYIEPKFDTPKSCVNTFKAPFVPSTTCYPSTLMVVTRTRPTVVRLLFCHSILINIGVTE
ncbi:hypothetical protein LINGRAHAP2_LOCUS9324, partial [Linum grandiflorum]